MKAFVECIYITIQFVVGHIHQSTYEKLILVPVLFSSMKIGYQFSIQSIELELYYLPNECDMTVFSMAMPIPIQ